MESAGSQALPAPFDSLLQSGGAAEIDARARLPVAFVAALGDGQSVEVRGAGDDFRRAAVMLGCATRMGLKPSRDELRLREDLPFAVQTDGKGMTIALLRDATTNPRLQSEISHLWLRAVAAAEVRVDLARVEHVNSVMIAWLLQVANHAKPAGVKVVGASRQVSTQLKQLRLDHLVTLS